MAHLHQTPDESAARPSAQPNLKLSIGDLSEAAGAYSPKPTLGHARKATAPPAKVRLLVVDDDLAAIRQLGSMLSTYAQVSFATSGIDALAMVRTRRPDLILLDADMPEVSGYEVFKTLRADPKTADVPVVFATSHTDPEIEASLFDMGAADFISKPFVASQVLARVKAQLQRDESHAGFSERDAAARPCLLVVGDDASAIQVLQHLLTDIGDCHFALDGAEALALSVTLSPDLVLLDIDMPGFDGFEVCRRLKSESDSHRPEVVFVTQFNTANFEAKAFEAGADDFIGKPFSSIVMHARVRRLVERKRSARADLRAARAALQGSTDAGMPPPDRLGLQNRRHTDDRGTSRTTQAMLSFIAHEMGNPLNAILGLAALASEDKKAPLAGVQLARLEYIGQAALRLKGLMHDVIDLGRLQAGKFRVETSDVEIERVIDGVCAELAIPAAAAGTRVAVDVQASPAVIAGDPRRLHQCVSNLLSNAIKYGGKNGRVDVVVRDEGNELVICVADSGPGLSESQRTQLFEPYNRLGHDASAVPGTGLGLLLTRELTAAMGGQLLLASGPGKGSCFSLRFPRPAALT